MKQNIIIFGSSSEVSKSFKKLLNKKMYSVYTISRSDSPDSCHLKLSNYIDDLEEIKEFVSGIDKPIIIFFNGYIAENRNKYEPNPSEISKTDLINFQIPYVLSNEINKLLFINKFVYISTIASVRPRFKNYIYGLSKNKLEKSLKFLNLNSYLVIKFGKIETSMSKNHKSPPFTMSSDRAAKIIIKKLKKTGVVTADYKIFLSKLIIILFPQNFINKF